ncbi:MAG: abortive infection protein [Comamonadaceae bacterium]|nr:MAG: abortive infection protein [Comamonadaceae bacterium]
MLYKLEIENFYSIRDRQEIDLRAAGNAPAQSDRLSPIWKGASDRCPKTVAIFGANASGKSTVLRALAFIAQFVMHSFSAPASQRILFDRFNEEESFNRPTTLAVEFAGISDLDDPASPECRYRYEVILGGKSAEPAYVASESVSYWPYPDSNRVYLFRRDNKGSIKSAKAFGLSGFNSALKKVLRPNASIISTLVQLKHNAATVLWNAANLVSGNIFIDRTDVAEDAIIRYYATSPDQLKDLNIDISRIDLGIREIRINQPEMGQNAPQVHFIHDNLSAPMPIHLESHGTRSFLKLYPIISRALQNGGIAIIDELDASIHPMILPEILGWFHDENRNPHSAQLWITCHNAALLDFLTKEEILFCEKDALGRTSVFGLNDVVGVRRSDNFYRKYLSGIYGAVPQLG